MSSWNEQKQHEQELIRKSISLLHEEIQAAEEDIFRRAPEFEMLLQIIPILSFQSDLIDAFQRKMIDSRDRIAIIQERFLTFPTRVTSGIATQTPLINSAGLLISPVNDATQEAFILLNESPLKKEFSSQGTGFR
jgi:hypothetical protein